MKNSKTTLMELTRLYRNVLKKCFLLNLGAIFISLPVLATETVLPSHYNDDLIVNANETVKMDGDQETGFEGDIQNLTVKAGGTLIATAPHPIYNDGTGELDNPTSNGVNVWVENLIVEKAGSLVMSGVGSHSVDFSDVKNATLSGDIHITNGRIETHTEDDPERGIVDTAHSTITLDEANVIMDGDYSNMESGGVLTVKDSTVKIHTDDHGLLSASQLNVNNSTVDISKTGYLIAVKEPTYDTETATGALMINNSTLNMADNAYLYGDSITLKESTISLSGNNHFLTTEEGQVSMDKSTLNVAEGGRLTILESDNSIATIADETDDNYIVEVYKEKLSNHTGTLTITDGTTLNVSGELQANADIQGGIVNIDSGYGLISKGSNGVKISGGKVTAENGYVYNDEILHGNNIAVEGGNLEISGGDILIKNRATFISDEDIIISGGTVTLDNDAEIWGTSIDKKTIISGGKVILTNDSDIAPEGTLEITGGETIATESEVAGLKAFDMSNGTLTLNNGVFGAEGLAVNEGDDHYRKGGKVSISGGTININPLSGKESVLSETWDYKSNVLMGDDITINGGEINIAKGAILAVRDGFCSDSFWGDVSSIALLGGTVNLSGSIDGNITAGETAGTITLSDSNAKINGNISGINLTVNTDYNSENMTGIINDLNNLTISENKSLLLNLDGKVTGLDHNDHPDLDVESFTMGKNSTLTLNGNVKDDDPDIDAWGNQYLTGTITLNNAGIKQNGPDGTITIENATLSTNGGDIASRSTDHDFNIINSEVTVSDAGIFKEKTGEGEEERGSGNLNINNSDVTLSTSDNFAVIVNSTENGNINIKDSTITMNASSVLAIGETDYDDETNQVMVAEGEYKGNIVLDNSILNMNDKSLVSVSGVGNGFKLTNGSELNVKGNNSIYAASPIEVQGSSVNIDNNAILALHKPEIRPEDGGTIHLGQGGVLNLFGTLDGNLVGNQNDKTKAGTLNIMSENSDITGIAHWLNVGLQANSTFIGEDIFIHDLTVGNDGKKAVQLTVNGDEAGEMRAAGNIASMTIKDGSTVLAKTSTAVWDKTGELDSPTMHGVALNISEIQVDKGATLELNGNGNHAVDIFGVETATINGTLKLINGRLEGSDEEPDSTITIDGAKVCMEGVSNIEAGGTITIKDSNVVANLDDHGFVSSSLLNVDNSDIALNGQSHMISYKGFNTETATGALKVQNKSTVTMKDTSILGGENVLFNNSKLNIQGDNHILSNNSNISFENKANVTIDEKSSLTVLSGKNIKNIDDLAYPTVLDAYKALTPSTGTLKLAKDTSLTNQGILNANLDNAGEVTNAGIINGNVVNTGTFTGLLDNVNGLLNNDNGILNTWGDLNKNVTGTMNLTRASRLNKSIVASNVNIQNSLDLGTNLLTANNVQVGDNATVSFRVADKDTYGQIKADTISISSKGTNLNLILDSGVLEANQKLQLQVLDSTALTGSFAKLTPNIFCNFKDLGNGLFEVSEKRTAQIISEMGGDSNDKKAASAWLENTNFVPGSVADTVLKRLATLTVEVLREAVKALQPDTAPTGQATAAAINNQVAGAVSGRFGGPSPQGRSGGDLFKNAGVWAQGLYNKAKLNTENGFNGKTKGLAMGIDGEVSEGLKIGFGYAYTTTDIDATGRSTDVDSHTGILYAEKLFGNAFVNGVATYGRSTYSENKNVAGMSVKADYDMDAIYTQLMTGYNFYTGNATITPETGLRYLWTKTHAYTDTADQTVDASTTDTLTGVIGARTNMVFQGKKIAFTPELKLAATYDIMNDKAGSVVRLANGSSYTTEGKSLNRFGVETGAKFGVTYDNMEFSLNYEGKFKKDYSDHTGMVNFRYNF